MKSYITYWSVIIFVIALLSACKKDVDATLIDREKAPRTLTIVVGMPTVRSITQEEGSDDIRLKWEVGQRGIRVVFYQGGKSIPSQEDITITEVLDDGNKATFNISIPDGIDTSQPFDLMGTTSWRTPWEGRFLSVGDRSYKMSDSDERLDRVPLYFEAFNIRQGDKPEIAFQHLGSMVVIHVKNTSQQDLRDISFELKCNTFSWYTSPFLHNFISHPGRESLILLPYEIKKGVNWMGAGAGWSQENMFPKNQASLLSGEAATFVHWVYPTGVPVPENLYSLTITGDNAPSNIYLPHLSARDALEIGKAYHIYAIYDGEILRLTQDTFPDQPPIQRYMTLTTEKAVGEGIILRIDAEERDKSSVWIDLNNNGVKDNEEGVTVFFEDQEYILGAQTITVYGNVTGFSCLEQRITSLDVSNNTALTELGCQFNQLTTLDVDNNTALKKFYCHSNQLTALDVGNNTALTNFYCCYNQLTSLDVSKNTALTTLNSSANPLISLDVSKNTALTYLSCEENQLTALDVSSNTALGILYCSSNQLTSLDVSKNTALSWLGCSSNQLTALDVSNNTALGILYCSSNQLTALDVGNNTALIVLLCESNQLTALDVSKNTVLTYLHCHSNEQLSSLKISDSIDDVIDCTFCKLSAETLNTIFETLPDVRFLTDGNKNKVLHVQGNPGADECNTKIATDKGWTIDVKGKPDVIAVTDISVEPTEKTLDVGASFTITVTVLPVDATNKEVTWTSSNEAVAIVSTSGEVRALTPGQVTITATTKDGNKTATCEIRVKKSEMTNEYKELRDRAEHILHKIGLTEAELDNLMKSDKTVNEKRKDLENIFERIHELQLLTDEFRYMIKQKEEVLHSHEYKELIAISENCEARTHELYRMAEDYKAKLDRLIREGKGNISDINIVDL